METNLFGSELTVKLITRPMIANLELPVGASIEIHYGFSNIEVTKGKILEATSDKFTVGAIDPIDSDNLVRVMHSDWFDASYDYESRRTTRVYLVDVPIQVESGELMVINVRTNIVVLADATEQTVTDYALRNVADISDLRVISKANIQELKLKLEI